MGRLHHLVLGSVELWSGSERDLQMPRHFSVKAISVILDSIYELNDLHVRPQELLWVT